MPRKELLAEVWQQSYGDDQTIDVHLSWLRRKLGETAARPRYLHTLRGVGVKLEPPNGSGADGGRENGRGMRWALVKVCLAVTAMVVVAFAVPLGLVVKEMARDRAFSNAERQAAAIGPALAITTDRDQLERAVASHAGRAARADGRAHAPAQSGERAAAAGARSARRAARAADRTWRPRSGSGRASITEVPGGSTLLQPTAVATGEIAVVEVFVPDERGHQRRRPPPGWCSPASASR